MDLYTYLIVHSSLGISLMFGSGVISSLSYNLDTAVFDADQVSLSLIGWWISQLSKVWRPQTTFVECTCPQWHNGHNGAKPVFIC